MRKGIGIAGLQRQRNVTTQFKEIGTTVATENIEQLTTQLQQFRSHLVAFAENHRKDLKTDAAVRNHFHRLCLKLGVDPLASTKGFWAELLGVGDFYYELGIQLIDVCMQLRDSTGGLVEMEEARKRLVKMRGGKIQDISEDDVTRAIKTLGPLKGGFDILVLNSKKLIQSVPQELSLDDRSVLNCMDQGFVSVEKICRELQWENVRAEKAVGILVSHGIVWIDSQIEPTLYWLAGVFKDI